MFAPAGYIPLIDLFQNAYNEVPQVYEYLVQRNTNLDIFTLEMADDILMSWVMDFCQDALYVTKDGTTLVRISAQALTSQHILWGTMNEELGEDTIATLQLPDEIVASHQFSVPVSKDDVSFFYERYEFYIDWFRGGSFSEIRQHLFEDECVQNLISRYADLRGHASPQLFLDYRSGTITLALYDHLLEHCELDLDEYWGKDVDSTARSLRLFDGYSVCVPESVIQNEWKNFWARRAQREIEKYKRRELGSVPEENIIKSRKRGPKATGARAEFNRRYPSGIPPELSQEAVAMEISEAGFQISPRSISNYNKDRIN